MKKSLIDLAVIGLTLAVALVLMRYSTPLVISPLEELSTTESSVLFQFKNANSIIIDDNIDFNSPLIINAEDNLVVTLQPGEYYWKLKGVRESEVRKINIVSKLDLRLKVIDGGYALTNAGNIDMEVTVYNGSLNKDKFILEKDSEFNSNGALFIGRENEK